MKSLVCSIAGSDSSGRAGVQADIKTFHALGVHGATIVTAVTAQNAKGLSDIQFIDIAPQLAALEPSALPLAIKLGMLGHASIIAALLPFLETYPGKVVLDPVLVTTSGGNLFGESLSTYLTQLKKLFPYVDVLTPNLPELEHLLNRPITSHLDMEQGARELLSLGVKSVLVKGGHHGHDVFAQDYWTNGKESCWLSSQRYTQESFSGTGCTLSSALAAALALGYEIKDALVIAKMYVNQAIRLCIQEQHTHAVLKNTLHHAGWPADEVDLPFVSAKPLRELPKAFPRVPAIGLYPIVDSVAWLETLIAEGVTMMQLRVKDKSLNEIESMVQEAIVLAKKNRVQLFINDYWELAIRHQAYGVHLGQEDIEKADIAAILAAGLHLGVSTHSYAELAKAHAVQPSYIAFGPIFKTETKQLTTPAQGIARLTDYRRLLSYPLVAIGGINQTNFNEVLATKVDGVAFISVITKALDPVAVINNLLTRMQQYAHT